MQKIFNNEELYGDDKNIKKWNKDVIDHLVGRSIIKSGDIAVHCSTDPQSGQVVQLNLKKFYSENEGLRTGLLSKYFQLLLWFHFKGFVCLFRIFGKYYQWSTNKGNTNPTR